jgi:hypothetical protein
MFVFGVAFTGFFISWFTPRIIGGEIQNVNPDLDFELLKMEE